VSRRAARVAVAVLSVLGGLLLVAAAGLFLLIGGPGIVHGLVWVWTHQRVEWLEAGGDRSQLDEITVPTVVPPVPELSELHFPDGRGSGQGGTPMIVTRRPGTTDWVGVFTAMHAGHRGAILDANRRTIASFTLAGDPPRNVDRIVMPTPTVLLMISTDRLTDGRYVHRLDQYDLPGRFRVARVAEDLFGTGIVLARIDAATAAIVYGSGELGMGMNMPRPTHSTVRVYSPKWPSGADVVRLSYGIGQVRAAWAERPDRLVLVTRFDHGLSVRRDVDRAWALTLR
jgi:hypothetical protein